MSIPFERGLVALRGGALGEARRWLETARRLEPRNAGAALALGSVMIRQKDPLAVALHREILAAGMLNEALCGLAAALRMVGSHEEAANTRGLALSLFSATRSANHEDALSEYCKTSQLGGWCGLAPGGRLTLVLLDTQSVKNIRITMDGALIREMPVQTRLDLDLPADWTMHRTLGLEAGHLPILGQPINLAKITHVEGLADTERGDLHGWAWCPHDPDHEPVLFLRCDGRPFGEPVIAEEPASEIRHWRPLARPRKFHIPAEKLRGATAPIEILGRDGRNLYGSPLDPAAGAQNAAFTARLNSMPFSRTTRGASRRLRSNTPLPRTPMLTTPVTIVGAAPAAGSGPGECAIILPIYDARGPTLRCLDSLLGSLPSWASVIAVNDASEDPELLEALADLAATGKITLLHHAQNTGFPAAANTGLAYAAGRDAVLLNSDTLLPPFWLERLRDAAYSSADIGTATPLSNDATLLSYPDTQFPNPIPDLKETCRLDRFAREGAVGGAIDIPTAIGFCMFIKRDCLGDTGALRADIFAQGYGEENDFCLRARHLGWRHVAVPNVFVGHVGGQSFGGARAYLRARNLRILNMLHPGYDELIAHFTRTDPLALARRAIDRARWCAARNGHPAVLLVTHGRRGGVQRRVQERTAALRAQGIRPLCLWPVAGLAGGRDCVLGDGPEGGTPNLRYAVTSELEHVAALLRDDNVVRIEVHSLIGHDHNVLGLADMLGVPYDMVLHDYASFCPRVTLVGGDNRFCGEPELAVCESCVADHGGSIEEDISVAYLRARSSVQLGAAASVIVPSADASLRLRRYFPHLEPLVTAWENDSEITARAAVSDTLDRTRVCIVGAIGLEKGFDILLACARDAKNRSLKLQYCVVGHTCDDGRMLQLGNVHITGEYDDSEAVELIRRQHAGIAFIPSIWPETWSYTLSQAWLAGLHVVAFDIGAPAHRIRLNGRGTLLPLGMPPADINNALVSLTQSVRTTGVSLPRDFAAP